MILAFDTYYFDDKAKTVCISFKNWPDSEIIKSYSETIHNDVPYKSGEFYKRELPCILSLFEKMEINLIEAILVDGFVFLDDYGKLGLGGRLYESLNKKIPVIGIAKSHFATMHQSEKELIRGWSEKPLYITSAGIGLEKAAKLIHSMYGGNRIPSLLKRLDRLTREK